MTVQSLPYCRQVYSDSKIVVGQQVVSAVINLSNRRLVRASALALSVLSVRYFQEIKRGSSPGIYKPGLVFLNPEGLVFRIPLKPDHHAGRSVTTIGGRASDYPGDV